MSIELKIKSKSLAVEASYIRREEARLLLSARWNKKAQQAKEAATYYKTFNNLRSHRKQLVRDEARATFLARAFIKGVPFKVVESGTLPSHNHDLLSRVVSMVRRYGGQTITIQTLEEWSKQV